MYTFHNVHTNNVSLVSFFPVLPYIITGSEDGKPNDFYCIGNVKLWHRNTYKHIQTINYGLDRAWSISVQKNRVAVAYEEGAVVFKLGDDTPLISWDGSGKLVVVKNADIMAWNFKAMAPHELQAIVDLHPINAAWKDLTTSDIYPQSVLHSPNGRFATVTGDGQFVIYTALAMRNKTFGSALDFCWSWDSNM